MADGWPSWLPSFVVAAHRTRASVLTFNYDTLLECAVATGLLYDWGAHDRVAWTELTGDVPNWPPGQMRWGAEPADTLRLLKLHGSLNWYWVPGDQSGATVARRVLPGAFFDSEPYTEQGRQRDLPGRSPFIVPPSAAKSSYYRNPITHEIWQQAAQRLSSPSTNRIVFIGYSLPLTDMTFGSMFRETVVRRVVPITVVDRNPEPIARRLIELGIAGNDITQVGGDNCVTDFVADWVHEVGRSALPVLAANGRADAPMFVTWSRDRNSTVVAASNVGGDVVLTVDQPGPAETIGRVPGTPGEIRTDLPTAASVLHQIRPLLLELPDGSRQSVIGADIADFQTGHATWNVLYPSGAAPRGAGG